MISIIQNGKIATGRALTAENTGTPTAGARPKTHPGGTKDGEASQHPISFGVLDWFDRNQWLVEQLLPQQVAQRFEDKDQKTKSLA